MKYLQVKLEDNIHDKFKQTAQINKSDMSNEIRKFIIAYIGETDEE